MSWIKLTRKEFHDATNEGVTINTDKIAYYTKEYEKEGSVVVLQSNYAILVTETVAEIDEKIGVNLASRPSSNLFDPCL